LARSAVAVAGRAFSAPGRLRGGSQKDAPVGA
jgi:hypothetical protein